MAMVITLPKPENVAAANMVPTKDPKNDTRTIWKESAPRSCFTIAGRFQNTGVFHIPLNKILNAEGNDDDGDHDDDHSKQQHDGHDDHGYELRTAAHHLPVH